MIRSLGNELHQSECTYIRCFQVVQIFDALKLQRGHASLVTHKISVRDASYVHQHHHSFYPRVLAICQSLYHFICENITLLYDTIVSSIRDKEVRAVNLPELQRCVFLALQ